MKGDIITAMPEGVVTALSSNLTAANFWGEITPVVGVVVGIALFAFGYRILNRVLHKGSKATPGV